jgi:hypothetical protein
MSAAKQQSLVQSRITAGLYGAVPEPCRRPAERPVYARTHGSSASTVSDEQHFTVPEVAALWRVSKETVRKMFLEEPGVLKFGHAEQFRARKRQYVSLRIPHSVMRAVHRRNSGSQVA